MVMGPVGLLTASVSRVTTSGRLASDAQSHYATRKVSAAVWYVAANSPTYRLEMFKAWETKVC